MSSSRADWPVRRYRLGEEPPADVSDGTTPEERLAIATRLASEGWALTGRPFPTYPRGAAPTRLYRPGEPRGSE